MCGLLILREVVPKYGSVFEIGLWIPFLRMNKKRELGRIAQKEDGSVIKHPVVVALLSLELDAETSGIPGRIGRTLLTTNSAESGHAFRLLTHLAEEIGTTLSS